MFWRCFDLINAADSALESSLESSELDDEFQICVICNTEEVIHSVELFRSCHCCDSSRLLVQGGKKLLQCSCCGQLVHPTCLDPPMTDLVSVDWSCSSCEDKTEENLQARLASLAELTKRFLFVLHIDNVCLLPVLFLFKVL